MSSIDMLSNFAQALNWYNRDMIDKNLWLKEVTQKLRERFAKRLLYCGLQGSYARGENTETSDFDLVVLLDGLDTDDLTAYKQIISSMPENEKMCGFIGAAQVLAAWPKSDLLQFNKETKDYFGKLQDFLPQITAEDVKAGVKTAAANIYHAACHTFMCYGENVPEEQIKELCKSASFVVQSNYYIKTGEYVYSKKDLPAKITGEDKEILSFYLDWDKKSVCAKKVFDKLLRWSGNLLTFYK